MSDGRELLRMLEPAVRPTGAPAPSTRPQTPVEQRAFDELLKEAGERVVEEEQLLRFSAHAEQRLKEMGVELTDAQLEVLRTATDAAQAKGANDSLILMKQLGMIVNIPNRTVVTVLGAERMQSGVVTQIDSTVMVDDPEQSTAPQQTYSTTGLDPSPR
jgi:flagellar operon protein